MKLHYRIFSSEDGSLVADEETFTRSRYAAIAMVHTWTRYDMGDCIILSDERGTFYDTSQPFRSLFRVPRLNV
jgi:hypothetical protein